MTVAKIIEQLSCESVHRPLELRSARTISFAMAVVPKPKGKKLFGGKAVILLGGYDKEGMRRWQERIRKAKSGQSDRHIRGHPTAD
jgi:hypothetical protein